MYPLSRKIYCGNCGALFSRKVSSKGYVTWSCRKHERRAADCPVGRIPESELYAAFVRMYHKLHLHAGLILSPALHQLNVLEDALHQKNPAMLEINRAIAQTAEQNCKIAKLQASGLIDIDACAAKQNALSTQLTRLRAQRQESKR